jgi:hypothetical protein
VACASRMVISPRFVPCLWCRRSGDKSSLNEEALVFSAEQCTWYWIGEWYRYWETQFRLSEEMWSRSGAVLSQPSRRRAQEIPQHLRLVVDNTRR